MGEGGSLVPLVVAFAALAFGVVTAGNCGVADWQQYLAFFGVPVVAGAGIGVALSNSANQRAGAGNAAWGLGLAIAAVSFFVLIGLFGASCS